MNQNYWLLPILGLLLFLAAPLAAEEGIVRYRIEENERTGYLKEQFFLERPGTALVPLAVDSTLSSLLLSKSTRYLNTEVDVTLNSSGPGAMGDGVRLESVTLLSRISDAGIQSVTGAKKLGVFLFTLSDAATIPTADEVRGVILNDAYNVKETFEENSRGTLSVGQVDVYGPFALARDKSLCDYDLWKNDVDVALAALGVNINQYDHLMYAAPNEANCAWAGLAEVGGKNSWYTEFGTKVVAHELGHNFGFGHAATNTNNAGTISEYGDTSCIQGRGYRWYNPVHLPRSEWQVDRGATVRTIDGVTNEVITLFPAEHDPATAGGLPQLVKIDRPGRPDPYYLAYRKNALPADISTDLGVADNRMVHVVRWAGGSAKTYLISRLAVGSSFSATEYGCAFNYTAEGANSATVNVVCTDFDSDGDGLLDAVDSDDDNDSVLDEVDCSPLSALAWRNQAFDDNDGDGFRSDESLQTLELCFGTEAPTSYTVTATSVDNCPFTYNPTQADADGDQVGDECDDGFEGDPGEVARPSLSLSVPARLVTTDEVTTISGTARHESGSPAVQYRIVGVPGGWQYASYESGLSEFGWSFSVALEPGRRVRYRVRAMYLTKKAATRGLVRRRRT